MSWIGRLRNLFREERMNAEFEEEMRFHLEARAADLVRDGEDAREAHWKALRSFGNPLALRDSMRDFKVIGWLADMRQDLGYALRMLRNHPGLALAAIGSLCLAIGINCAIFTVLNALVLKPLPVRDPQSLVHLYVPLPLEEHKPKEEGDSFSYLMFQEMRRRAADAAELFSAGLVGSTGVVFQGDEHSVDARYQCISGDAFRILGLQPAYGRLLTAADDVTPGAHPVAVLSYGFWQRHFAAAPGIIGRGVVLNGQRYEILGVAPKGFDGIDVGSMVDIFVPLTMWYPTQGLLEPGWANFRILGRMRTGVPLDQLTARVQSVYAEDLARKAKDAFPDGRMPREARQYFAMQVHVRPAPTGPSRIRAEFLDALTLLTAVAGLVLLVACCNVANLLLARATARRAEMAMRVSLGASRTRLLRQMLTESAVIGVLASAGGLLLALIGGPGIVRLLADSDHPVQITLDPDWRVFAFLLAMCLLTTLLCGLVPAFRAFRTAPNAELRGRSEFSSGFLAGRALVFVQIALSFVLVSASVLFALSLRSLLTADAGFSRREVVLADVQPTADRAGRRWDSVCSRIELLPGVQSCAYSTWGLFSGARRTSLFGVPGQEPGGMQTIVLGVSPRFFETMGTPILRGRAFLPGERPDGVRPPILVNRAAARQFFGDAPPIGRRLRRGAKNTGPRFEVIGLVKDAKYLDIREEAPPMIYTIHEGSEGVTFAVRAADGVGGLAGRLRAAIRESDPALRIGAIQTQAEAVEKTLAREKLLARISGLFALIGTVLAVIGVYGVLHYFVARRTQAIGIRSALGASKASVAGTVVGHVAPAFLTGIAAGMLAAAALGRFAASLVFGLAPRDPRAFILAGGILLLAGLLAALIPVARAAGIDPATSMRCE